MTSEGTAVLLDVDGVVNRLSRPGARAARMRLEAAVGSRLRRLASAAEVVWTTDWDAATRATITATFGLPELRATSAPEGEPRAASTNLPAVDAWSRTREPPGGWRGIVWIDDELAGDAQAWADEQPFPVLLIRPDPVQGLQDLHVDRALEFLAAPASR